MSADPANQSDSTALAKRVREAAIQIGFDLVGIAPAMTPAGFDHLRHWLDRQYEGEMQYMKRRESAYEHPDGVLPGTRSVIVVGLNYHHDLASDSQVSNSDAGTASAKIAKYAQGHRDYHDVIRRLLKELASVLHAAVPDCRTRTVVDTAPLLERDFAKIAGLGWFGKNTMLINKQIGSWLFLGAVLTDVSLEPDAPHETSHCGTCTRCLEACPTDAFPEPYVLDARKCISYLTIELRDQPIPDELREGMHDWVFGCDICQDVCPWNRKAPSETIDEFVPSEELASPDLGWILSLDESEFRTRFKKTPFDRPGRSGVLRNAAIAAGNSGDAALIPLLLPLLKDSEPLIRGAAAWALGIFSTDESKQALRDRLRLEPDSVVREEIQRALGK